MTPSEYNFIKECIGIQSRPYYYFKDKYALDLIRILLDRFQELRISDLKKSNFSFLLQKQPLKDLVSRTGRNYLRMEDLSSYENMDGRGFSYTISEWGEYKSHRNDSYYQTSRPGVNLVLRLNFDDEHNWIYNSLINPDKKSHPFAFTGHPVSVKKEYTMCWARLDISLETGEILVEEIQNDWLREVHRIFNYLEKLKNQKKDFSNYWLLKHTSFDKLQRYYYDLLKPYYKLWDEAILNLIIKFAKEELGLFRLYYHTFDSGRYLKGYWRNDLPPRSIYTKLPKRFGFVESNQAPEFIKNESYLRRKLRKRNLNWFSMIL